VICAWFDVELSVCTDVIGRWRRRSWMGEWLTFMPVQSRSSQRFIRRTGHSQCASA
jgi:hypothetical protein